MNGRQKLVKVDGAFVWNGKVEANKVDGEVKIDSGLVVMGGDSCFKGRGFESRYHILDRHFSHTYLL